MDPKLTLTMIGRYLLYLLWPKSLQKLSYNQLYNYLNVNNLLIDWQSGFSSLHSTLTALLETSNNWCVNGDKGLLNGVIFIYLKKAFDSRSENHLAKTC